MLSSGFRIVPDICNCNLQGGGSAGAGWGCVLQVVQNLFQFVIYLGILFCVFGVVYAAFVWILSPVNAGNREKGREIFTNAVIGLVIVLSAYLLVNTLLNFLTGKSVSAVTAVFGTTSGNCLPTASDQIANTNANGGTTTGISAIPNNPSSAPAIGNFGVASAANYADSNALGSPSGQCAQYVRKALSAGGITQLDSNHPVNAYQYGPYLTQDGFQQASGPPQAGDVVVFQPVDGHPSGHIALYDGSSWVSDFKQNSIYPATAYQGSPYTIYRYSGN